MSEAPKWYVVHTYSGYENKVASDIENAVENRKLHDLIAGVMFLPKRLLRSKTTKSVKWNARFSQAMCLST